MCPSAPGDIPGPPFPIPLGQLPCFLSQGPDQVYEGITFEDFLKVGDIPAVSPEEGPGRAQGRGVAPAPLSPGPRQMWQGIDIETKMHVRFLNVDTIAHCY